MPVWWSRVEYETMRLLLLELFKSSLLLNQSFDVPNSSSNCSHSCVCRLLRWMLSMKSWSVFLESWLWKTASSPTYYWQSTQTATKTTNRHQSSALFYNCHFDCSTDTKSMDLYSTRDLQTPFVLIDIDWMYEVIYIGYGWYNLWMKRSLDMYCPSIRQHE